METDRQTWDRWTDRQAWGWTWRLTDRHRDKEMDRQTDMGMDRQTCGRTDGHGNNRQTWRLTDGHGDRPLISNEELDRATIARGGRENEAREI